MRIMEPKVGRPLDDLTRFEKMVLLLDRGFQWKALQPNKKRDARHDINLTKAVHLVNLSFE